MEDLFDPAEGAAPHKARYRMKRAPSQEQLASTEKYWDVFKDEAK